MARRSKELGILKLGVLSAALIVGLALPANAGDTKLVLSGSASFTTDYMFRSISNSGNGPAVQPEFDLTYGIFYGYIWGSNVSSAINQDGIEIDYGAGITPKWAGIDFNIAGLYYTYPGNTDISYFELRTSAAHTFDKLTLSIGNWWSPDYAQTGFQSDAIEFGASYAFAGKLWNFFTPTISGAVGRQTYESIPDYTYWNAGLSLGFLNHWSADIRYYDTADYSRADCLNLIGNLNACDARAVGTIKATF
jgi:uncharacterized protein (TIGR02001 family)